MTFNIEYKACIKCGEEKIKNIENFRWRTDTNKFRGQCRICDKVAHKKYLEKRKKNKNLIKKSFEGKFKECTECLCKKLVDVSFAWLDYKCRYNSKCKSCVSKINSKVYHSKDKLHLKYKNRMIKYNKKCKELNIIIESDDEYLFYKICSQCKTKQEINNFQSYYSGICLICRDINKKMSQENFHKRNPEYKSKLQQQYYKNNREEILIKGQERRKDPIEKEKERERKKKYRQKKGLSRNKSVAHKLRHSVSCGVRDILRGRKKHKSILQHLPYTMEELKKYLENLFEPWMNWNNWGLYNPETWVDEDEDTYTWQIDHIIPQSELPYDSMEHPNFQKCCALENLRPLSAKQNILDGVNRKRHKNNNSKKGLY